MEVIVITAAERKEEEIPDIINLFEQGLTALHLRKPKFSHQEIENFLNAIPKSYHNRVVIHGHYELALKYNLKGIHLQRSHRFPKWKNRWKRFLLKMRKPGLQVSTTFRSVQSLNENGWSFDYVLLGPVFTAQAHYHLDDPATVNALRSQISQTKQRVYAIGGVNEERMPLLRQAGFEGVGISGAVWKLSKNEGFGSVISRFKAA